MSSIVDKYYRKIYENIDNLKMKFDISALLVKTKEHDSKINTNVSDISDNLGKIETNESNISDNLGKIDTNENNISDNFNFTQINKKKSEFNTSLIDTNRDNIASNLDLINTNKNSITNIKNDLTNLKNDYKLKDIIVFNIDNSNSQDVSKNKPSFVFFNNSINSFIKKDSCIEINLRIYLIFLLHYVNIGYFYVLLKILNDKNQLISSTKIPLIGMISKHAIISNICYIKLPNDYNIINLELSIELKENQSRSDIIKILQFDNYVYCKIYEKLDNSIEFDV